MLNILEQKLTQAIFAGEHTMLAFKLCSGGCRFRYGFFSILFKWVYCVSGASDDGWCAAM